MRDYTFIQSDGSSVTVANMSDKDLHECLSLGIVEESRENPNDTITQYIERMKLEVFIRENNLRTGG